MKLVIVFLISISIIFSHSLKTLAIDQNQVELYIEEWNQKRGLAFEYLEKAQKAFESGDELTGCVQEKEAAKYGIEGTKSLILANKISESGNDINELEAGLAEWYKLRDYC